MTSQKMNRKVSPVLSGSAIRGFTLIEVVIALATFSFLIAGILGFLPWGIDSVDKVKDRSTAYGMIDGVQIELERLGFSYVEEATKRLDGLYSEDGKKEDAASLNELIVVASRNGGRIATEKVVQRDQNRLSGSGLLTTSQSSSDLRESNKDFGGKILFDRHGKLPVSLNGFLPEDEKTASMGRWIDQKDRYFKIICRQYAMMPGRTGESPSLHAHDVSNGYLALEIEVQWPYKISTGEDFTEIEERFRSKFKFPLAITR